MVVRVDGWHGVEGSLDASIRGGVVRSLRRGEQRNPKKHAETKGWERVGRGHGEASQSRGVEVEEFDTVADRVQLLFLSSLSLREEKEAVLQRLNYNPDLSRSKGGTGFSLHR